MKICAITNGISANYEEACKVLNETGVKYAELQFLEGTTVDSLSLGGRNLPGFPVESLALDEAYKIRDISRKYGIIPACVTTHAFNGISIWSIETGDEKYNKHMAMLKNGIAFAKIVGTKLVRTMCFSRETVLFGSHGGKEWLAHDNQSWDKFISLFRPIAKLGEDEGIDIMIENGFSGFIPSTVLMRKMADDLGSNHIKFLWDPANALYYREAPTVEAYETIKDILAHVHIKDAVVDPTRSQVDIRNIGRGQLAPYLQDLAEALRKDSFEGCISLENIYKPDGGTFLDGYYLDIAELKKIFE